MSCHHQNRLDGSHPKVVVVLLRQLSAGQLIQVHDFPGQGLGRDEALGEQHDLCNLIVVGHHHGHRSEEGLQVVWQIYSTGISIKAHIVVNMYLD